jgi:hypothetical protein
VPPTRRYVLEGWEEEVAVLVEAGEDRTIDLPRWMIPTGAREGDTILIEAETAGAGARRMTLRIEAGDRREREEEAEARLRRLREGDPGGDRV